MEADKRSDERNFPLHRPVMGPEVVENLAPQPGEVLLDVTAGTGGHALLLGRHLGEHGLVAAMDADEGALEVAEKRLESGLDCRVRLFKGNFSEAGEVLKIIGRPGFDLILADLGVGTHQLDDPARGFSFESEYLPDMRFDTASGRSAGDVVNREKEEVLADIFFRLGGERFSRPIASEICRHRPLASARELGDIAKKIYASRSGGARWRIHPATRIFMALRIHVNNELKELDMLLRLLPEIAAPGARAAVITYHSLEARRVKLAWRNQASEGKISILTPKPIMPSEEEISANPRARSAQLRAAKICSKAEERQ